MREVEIPVLVVGGGPVGLTLAADLAWRGQRCMIVEQRTEPTDHPKATLLGSRSMEHYRRWQLDAPIFEAGLPQAHGYFIVFATRLCGHELHRFASPSVAEVRGASPEAQARWPELRWSPYSKTQIGQQALEPVLLDFARGLRPAIDFRHGWRLLEFADHGDHVYARIECLQSGEQQAVRARYLVGCDGGSSTVRKALGIRLSGRGRMRSNVSFFFRSREFLATHTLGPANLYFIFTPDSFGVVTAIDGREFWNYQYYFLDPAQQTDKLDATTILHRAMGKSFSFELLKTTHWSHHQAVAKQWQSGRVFLAGDAAHLFPPTGGVGMNTGIGDAVDLAWKLDATLRGWGGAQLLVSYERERKPVAIRNSIVSANNSDKIDMVMDETPADIETPGAAGDARRRELARKIRWFAKQFNSAGVHLGARYVDSPLCVADGTPEPPDDPTQLVPSTWPGSRAPHHWLAPGRSTLDFFGRDFVLLSFGEPIEVAAELASAFAERSIPLRVAALDDAVAARLYETKWVLVRPDGYVAWRGDRLPHDPLSLVDRVRGALAD